MVKSRLSEIANKLGKNATQIAEETGVNRNTINSLMSSKTEDFRFSTIEKIARKYNLKITDLIDFDNIEKQVSIPKKLYRQEGALIPFTCWTWAIAVNQQAKEYFETNFGEFRLFCKGQYGWAYWDYESLYKLSKNVYEKYGNSEKINEIYSIFLSNSKPLENIYLEADLKNLLKLSNDSLTDYFSVLWNAYQKFWKYSVFIDSFDPGLDHEEITKISERYKFSKDEVSILTTPIRMTFNKERELFLLVIIDGLLRKNIPLGKLEDYVKKDTKIREYKKKFDYYKSNYAFIRPIENNEIIEEIRKYLSEPELFKNEYKALKKYSETQQEVIRKVLKSHNLKSNPLEFFNLLTFWREERKKVNLMGIYVLDLILQVIEEKTGIPKKYLQYLSFEEVRSVLKGLVSRTVLEARYKDGILVTFNESGYRIIEGKEATSLYDELEKQYAGDLKLTSFYGQTACQGYAKGIARIVLEEKDFSKFNDGEILITGMTRPEFVPLMKKAAGIVTNEGGITCHAAIVSRELGKPCIIGTKNATQLIKDGDLVEVRANHGTVRIIK